MREIYSILVAPKSIFTKVVITISGDIGSGKSTTGKLICKKLEYKYLSTGAIQRQIAEEMGLTTLELNHLTDSRKDIDDKIDAYTKALNDTDEDYVVDSRLAWHFIPSSYKIYLLCDEDIAAQRISKDNDRASDETNREVDHLISKIKERRKSEQERFKKIYGINFGDLSNYDQLIDTAYFTPEEVVDLILDGIDHYYPR